MYQKHYTAEEVVHVIGRAAPDAERISALELLGSPYTWDRSSCRRERADWWDGPHESTTRPPNRRAPLANNNYELDIHAELYRDVARSGLASPSGCVEIVYANSYADASPWASHLERTEDVFHDVSQLLRQWVVSASIEVSSESPRPKAFERPASGKQVDFLASTRWLRENRKDHERSWVALRAGHLLGSSTTRAELRRLISRDDDQLAGVLLVWVEPRNG